MRHKRRSGSLEARRCWLAASLEQRQRQRNRPRRRSRPEPGDDELLTLLPPLFRIRPPGPTATSSRTRRPPLRSLTLGAIKRLDLAGRILHRDILHRDKSHGARPSRNTAVKPNGSHAPRRWVCAFRPGAPQATRSVQTPRSTAVLRAGPRSRRGHRNSRSRSIRMVSGVTDRSVRTSTSSASRTERTSAIRSLRSTLKAPCGAPLFRNQACRSRSGR